MLAPEPVLPFTLLVFLLIASGYDLWSRRIPNWLIVSAIVSRFAIPLVLASGLDFEQFAMGGLVGLLLFMIPYALGKMGAGDVKLMLVCGLYLGPILVIKVALYAMLAGGVLALLAFAYQKLKGGRHVGLPVTVPYAIAISTGALIVLLGG